MINALLARIQAAGVAILTGAQVTSLQKEGGRVNSLIVNHSNTCKTILPNKIIWTSGLPGIAKLLGLNLTKYSFDSPRKTVVVNLLLRKPPNMGDLYYLYCYEPGCHTFRINLQATAKEHLERADGLFR